MHTYTLAILEGMIEQYRRTVLELPRLPQNPQELLVLRDQIEDALENLADLGTQLEAQRARIETFDQLVRRHARALVRGVSAASLQAHRGQAGTPPARWWWYLDALVARAQRRRLNRWVRRAAVAAAVLFGIWATFTWVLPHPPAYVEHQQEASHLLSQGDWQGAEQEYQAALRLNPQDVTSHLMMGILAQRRGATGTADAEFARAQELAADPVSFYLQRAGAYLQINELGRAEADAQQAVHLAPGSIEAHFLLGSVLEAQDRIPEALPHLQLVADSEDADPKLAVMARFKLGMLMLRGAGAPLPR
jgi:tetratricopeptide (TPR) repeat protein